MYKIINLSTYEYDMKKFDNDTKNINDFLNSNNIDGIELFGISLYSEGIIPKYKVKGVHLRHYPMWLDFWNNNKEGMLDDFKSLEDAKRSYGGNDKKSIISEFRKEIILAEELEAEYVVFHVSNVKLKHCFDYKFTYTDKEVIDGTIEMINEIFKNLDTNITILFENLWWPGLRLVDKGLVEYFIENIQYENKGIMLDTSHLINTNLEINNEEEGIDYLIDTVNNLGEMKKYIKGIHLSKSNSSEYVKSQICKYNDLELDIDEMNEKIIYHVMEIDQHNPFTNKGIKKLIDIINPEYLVYEFITYSIDELREFIKIQDEALDLHK